jgi:enamine deaminase RidA (YjgF/YER057c/UK114 family)
MFPVFLKYEKKMDLILVNKLQMTKEIKRIEPGPRLSEAVIYNGIVYSAGVVADKTMGKSVLEQTKEVLQQIDDLLAGVGSHKTKILKANIWLADISTRAQMNEAWDAWVVPGQTPARATVESKLADPGYAVEIMIEAAV